MARGHVTIRWYDGIHVDIANARRTGLNAAGEHILQVANDHYTPFDEGTLAGSGEVTVNSSGTVASISYDTPYAARLHEHPEYNFQHGRIGKYLITAMQREAANASLILRQEFARVFHSGGLK